MKGSQNNIMPAGPLMNEHRLIERLIAVLKKETESMAAGSELNTLFIKEAAEATLIPPDVISLIRKEL